MKNAMTTHARSASLGLALLLCMSAASAQMYKWVDANGKTHFTDTPPPAAAKTAPIKAGAGGNVATSFPYALADAVARNPVTLYTTDACTACDNGRALLRRKGIPFTEKTVTTKADQEKLKELGAGERLPILMVGRSKSSGFAASIWESALSLASYPERSMLPSTYQYPSPTSLAPRPSNPDQEAVRVAAAAAEAEAARKKDLPPEPAFKF